MKDICPSSLSRSQYCVFLAKLMQDCNAVGVGGESFMLLTVPAHKIKCC